MHEDISELHNFGDEADASSGYLKSEGKFTIGLLGGLESNINWLFAPLNRRLHLRNEVTLCASVVDLVMRSGY